MYCYHHLLQYVSFLKIAMSQHHANNEIVPPLGIFLISGCSADLLINILLTILGYAASQPNLHGIRRLTKLQVFPGSHSCLLPRIRILPSSWPCCWRCDVHGASYGRLFGPDSVWWVSSSSTAADAVWDYTDLNSTLTWRAVLL